jgi:XRE family transcriptional regulator, regulator of sulfur utilization
MYPFGDCYAMPATNRNPSLAKAFGDTVRALRESQGIAQEALALAADMDRSYLGRLERGEKQPSLDVVFRVAAALQIDAHKLVARVANVVD